MAGVRWRAPSTRVLLENMKTPPESSCADDRKAERPPSRFAQLLPSDDLLGKLRLMSECQMVEFAVGQALQASGSPRSPSLLISSTRAFLSRPRAAKAAASAQSR